MQVVKTAHLRSPQEQYLSNDKCTYPILPFMTRCTSSIVVLHHYQDRRRERLHFLSGLAAQAACLSRCHLVNEWYMYPFWDCDVKWNQCWVPPWGALDREGALPYSQRSSVFQYDQVSPVSKVVITPWIYNGVFIV